MIEPLNGTVTQLVLLETFIQYHDVRIRISLWRGTRPVVTGKQLLANTGGSGSCDGSHEAKKLKAVRAYCDETGLGVPEGRVAVEGYLAKEEQQSDSVRPEDD